MVVLHHVTSLERPELEPYRTLRRPLDHQRQGIFVAEGEKVVARLLESNLRVLSVLLTPTWFDVYTKLLEERGEQIDVFVADKKLLEGIVGFSLHQGIMAVANIPPQTSLEAVLASHRRPYFLAAVDGLTNAENLGVLVRNCVGFGVHALLVGETSSSPYLRRAVRNSMGTVFRLPVVQVENLSETLRQMKTTYGIQSLAAHPHSEHATVFRTDFTTDCCIVFGSEGEGIAPRVLAACDGHIAIPMHNGVDSLNVASASAVFFYEVARQRGMR
jgi:tRNA G18 (ribose-2'-O)-methylase SpoU